MSSIRSAELRPFVFFMSRARLTLAFLSSIWMVFVALFLLLGLLLQLLDLEAYPNVLYLCAIIAMAPSKHVLVVCRRRLLQTFHGRTQTKTT